MKKTSDKTNDEILLSYTQQLEKDNERLQKELNAKSKPFVDLGKFPESDEFGILCVVGAICLCIITVYHMWPSEYETGRFYVTHRMTDYKPPKECINKGYRCRLPPGDMDSCYKVIKEVENGTDSTMTKCMRDKNEAYKAANEFTDGWKKLKDKSKDSRDE